MADFEQVILKAMSKIDASSRESRFMIYTKARQTIRRKIDSLPKKPPQIAIDAQYDKLESACHNIEKLYQLRDLETSVDDEPKIIVRREIIKNNISDNFVDISLQSYTMLHLIQTERERLEAYLPNHPTEQNRKEAQLELLDRLEEGLSKLSSSMSSDDPEKNIIDDAADDVEGLAESINEWWKDNSADAIDLAVRIPVAVGSIALLSQAGAEMTTATAGIFAMVGGQRVIDALKTKKD